MSLLFSPKLSPEIILDSSISSPEEPIANGSELHLIDQDVSEFEVGSYQSIVDPFRVAIQHIIPPYFFLFGPPIVTNVFILSHSLHS